MTTRLVAPNEDAHRLALGHPCSPLLHRHSCPVWRNAFMKAPCDVTENLVLNSLLEKSAASWQLQKRSSGVLMRGGANLITCAWCVVRSTTLSKQTNPASLTRPLRIDVGDICTARDRTQTTNLPLPQSGYDPGPVSVSAPGSRCIYCIRATQTTRLAPVDSGTVLTPASPTPACCPQRDILVVNSTKNKLRASLCLVTCSLVSSTLPIGVPSTLPQGAQPPYLAPCRLVIHMTSLSCRLVARCTFETKHTHAQATMPRNVFPTFSFF